ncbi:unnamed protein product, partial [Mesorhabditis belari]|uniref:Uncharacterized protein n=1 Tax=Mesorhabditis belari TaxID=2138241 RepID=A0AAF3E8B3_9BILA
MPRYFSFKSGDARFWKRKNSEDENRNSNPINQNPHPNEHHYEEFVNAGNSGERHAYHYEQIRPRSSSHDRYATIEFTTRATRKSEPREFVHHIAIEREPPKTPLRTASSQSLHSTVLKQQHRQHTHVRDHQNDVFSTVKTARLPEEFSTTAIYQKGNLLDEKGLTKGRGVLVSSFRSHHSSASTNATKTSYEEEERYRCEHLLTRANGGPPLKESDFHGDTPVVHYHYVAGSLECFHSISRSNSKKRRNERHGDSGRKRTKDKGEMERWIESQHSQQVTTHRKPPPIPVFDEKPQISTIGTEKSTKSTEDGDLYEELGEFYKR